MTPPLPVIRAGCIFADPPWAFLTYNGAGVPTQADDPYETMSLDELMALDIASVSADDALLVIYVISSHIDQALKVGAGWGFTYKSLGPVWVKERSPNQTEMFGDAPICDLGMGHWFRQQAEIALLFTRGRPKRLSASVRQVINEPAREHSRKPDENFRRLEKLVAGPYLELFGRNPRKGWTVWGNQTTKYAAAE